MKLNVFVRIVEQEWHKTIEIRDNISLGEFIIMPNHIHGIIHINLNENKKNSSLLGEFKSPSQTIGAIIRGFKGASTKKIKAYFFDYNSCESGVRANCNSPQPQPILAPTAEELELLSRFDLSKSIWQRNYYEHIIKNQLAFENITNYIKDNPKNWNPRSKKN